MDWRTVLGLLAGLINIASIIPYVRDVLAGSTRPNIVTWFLWTLIGAILSYAQYTAGASWTLALLVGATLSDLVVTILSIRHGQRRYGWIDGGCFAVAMLAIIAWWWTSNPVAAIIVGVMAEICAASPTIRKAYHKPESETPIAYAMSTCAGVLSLVASTRYDLANVLYPAYAIVSSGLIAALSARQYLTNWRSRTAKA
jgi:hypothetical protein